MKTKIAKRSASQYEDSLSSHGSCADSILTYFQLSSCIISSPYNQKPVKQDLFTPSKNVEKDRSYSQKKLFFDWQLKQGEESEKNSSWCCESQDSKLRKKQGYNKSIENKQYKRHAKTLNFEEDTKNKEADKENAPLNAKMDHQSSDDEKQETMVIRGKAQGRKVGKVLYFKDDALWPIVEEDTRNSRK